MKNCLHWQIRVLGYAWWLLLLLPVLALLMGWEAIVALEPYLRRGGGSIDARSALAVVLEVRHFFPLAGAVWASLFLGMDYSSDAQASALSRGYRRKQLIWCKYLLFLLGCASVSVIEQVFVVFSAVPDWQTLPAAFLLRCFCLRLVLDVGIMALPAVVCFAARENLYIRLMGLIYGVVLWRLMGSHYALWLQYAEWSIGEILALWPLGTLVLSSLSVVVLSRRAPE